MGNVERAAKQRAYVKRTMELSHDDPRRMALVARRLQDGRIARTRRQQYLNEIKLVQGCVDCGYREHPEALDFDHLPEYEKCFGIAGACTNKVGWKRLEAELAKCVVRCANCHRIKTAKRRMGG